MVQPFPLIEVSGDAAQRGLQYGRQARERVHRGISHYTEQLRSLDLDAASLQAVVRDYLPVMESFDPQYVVEMRGIAKGADVSFEDIVLLNARSEVLKLAANPALREALGAGDLDGCTALIALPGATADGRLIHAQNWDWKYECAETAVVLRVRRQNEPDVLTFTEAGALARSGLNSVGIGLTGNFLESSLDFRRVGVPLPLIRRKVLEQAHLALAMRAAYVTRKSGSNNMMISHAGGVGLNFECAPDETFLVHAERDLLVHANHWLSPVALGKLKDMGIASTPDTLYRDMRVRQLLEQAHGRIDVETVKRVLLDDFASPWSVCRPVRLNLASNLSATVATVVLRPADNVMEIAALPAVDSTFTAYDFSD